MNKIHIINVIRKIFCDSEVNLMLIKNKTHQDDVFRITLKIVL